MELHYHFFGISFILGLLLSILLKSRNKKKRVCIVVLGDIGRSPRMQYHAASFAREGYFVEIVGYLISSPIQKLQNNCNVKIHSLHSPPSLNNKLTKAVAYGIKVVWQSLDLAFVLFKNCDSSFLLLQNPPAVPAIPVCWLYCFLMKVEFMIDWHNYAYTIMALNLKQDHVLVKLAKFVESFFGSKATTSFCVTKAMQSDLNQNWNIKAQVLYDRPAEEFCPISLSDKHALLMKLSQEYFVFKGQESNCTALTEMVDEKVNLLAKRPALVVSSTSWTEDEDFSILIDALEEYDECCKDSEYNLPNLICAVTGKGHLKEFYEAIVKNRSWKHVSMITPWLESEDYPKLLASADLGISLHTSSSGLDLPMKVVDMFGCGLVVCAMNFKCLNELVKHNENSLVFSSWQELSEQLKLWFKDFPETPKNSSKFKNELKSFQESKWHENWKNVVLPNF